MFGSAHEVVDFQSHNSSQVGTCQRIKHDDFVNTVGEPGFEKPFKRVSYYERTAGTEGASQGNS